MWPRLTLNSQCSLTSLLSAECWDSSPIPAILCVFLSPNTWVYHFHHKMGCGDEAFLSVMWIALGSSGRGFLHLQLNAHCQMIIPESVFLQLSLNQGWISSLPCCCQTWKSFAVWWEFARHWFSEKAGIIHKYTDTPSLLWISCLYVCLFVFWAYTCPVNSGYF